VRREREELIDFVLGELPEGREAEVRQRVDADPAEHDELVALLGVVRAAAAGGWGGAGAVRRRWLRPALAAAAVLLVAFALLLRNGAPREAIYEPDVAFGYLLPEETDAAGRVRTPSAAEVPVLRAGEAAISALGSARADPVAVGGEIPYESEIRTPADTGARIDLPDGAILFVGPTTALRLRRHQAGGPAVRVLLGTAATVAGRVPLHLAVHETDLLLRQESGALLLRQQPAEAIALRGVTDLLLAEGERFRIPPGQRLPAACAKEPFTVPATVGELDLDWYLALVYGDATLQAVPWEAPGVSGPLARKEGTLLFLRLGSMAGGRCTVSFGGPAREFTLRRGVPLSLRVPLTDLGPGPHLLVTPPETLQESRLFHASVADCEDVSSGRKRR
jgi:hypothetical protein